MLKEKINPCTKFYIIVILFFIGLGGIFFWIPIGIYIIYEKNKRNIKTLNKGNILEIIGFFECNTMSIIKKEFKKIIKLTNDDINQYKKKKEKFNEKWKDFSDKNYDEIRKLEKKYENQNDVKQRNNKELLSKIEESKKTKEEKQKNNNENINYNSVSGKSIWDNYESVLDTMNKKK